LSITHKTNKTETYVINALATGVAQQYKYVYEGMWINKKTIVALEIKDSPNKSYE